MLSILRVRFDLPLAHYQIPRFRAAMSELAGFEVDWFHNHEADGRVKYRYPMIQYRVFRDKAGLIALNQGAEALYNLLTSQQRTIRLGNQKHFLRIEEIRMDRDFQPQITKQNLLYQLNYWLPLNQKNYSRYQNQKGLVAKVQMLEYILANQIITFAKGVNWQIPEQVVPIIESIEPGKKVHFHGNPFLAFQPTVSINVKLPDGIGLGRAAGFGFGILDRKRKRKRIRLTASK